MNPKVSIIVPVYNASKYIEESLHSLFNQSYSNIEIIAINDGSTDDSIDILSKYSNKIKIIDQSNMGQCKASNNGLKVATGEYIKFFDADDIMNPNHIELQIKKINGQKDCIASCEWGRFYNNDHNSAQFEPESVWQDLPSFDWIKQALSQKHDMMGAWLWLIPIEVINKCGGWNEGLSLNNDFEFSIRLLLQSKEVLFTKGAKIYYRSGLESNLANTKSLKAYQSAILSTDLGCKHILSKENSEMTRLICANRYQDWLFRIYPSYPNLTRLIKLKIKELGGSNKRMEGGKVFNITSSFVGWKLAKRTQLFLYKVGYIPKNPHK
ncbi:glycosyltransferase family 2 protein [Plebeiibacterium sediminum]|uniref:Glycosyltransferase family 2 protein n=1 Tax=Plebeiibacterium sediminum TaxID=2992112 RepID=A0AAE3SIG1_9BACT|nr:glycosyltransferase family A protein [Plebeiobacterium sediminum]MCW3789198.1 glycosyltransferase family 2 protein [Plebeiobacterium sediminum]